MMKTEYAESGGFLQRNNVEHEEYSCNSHHREYLFPDRYNS